MRQVGDKFGLLTILEEAEPYVVPTTGKTQKQWLVICDCGNKRIVRDSNLRSGNSRSCGCNTKYRGLSKTGAYNSWRRMMSRCYRPDDDSYHQYGGRGIGVCKEWHDFKSFFQAMGQRPVGYTLDRLDSSKDYSPENCQWLLHSENSQKKTNNVYIEYRGRSMHRSAWAREAGIPKTTLKNRLDRGWSFAQAIGDKPPPKNSHGLAVNRYRKGYED